MLLPTTLAGSLPKPVWLADARPGTLWAPWKLEGAALATGKQDAVRLALFAQEHAGIDIVTDGEQTRQHFVTTFIEGLDGVDFAHKRTVRIRNRYDADVPVVVGPVARRRPIYVDDAAFLRRETRKATKYTLPGPMTMVDTLYDDHYRSREKLAFAFAEILNEEALAIEAAGIDTVQFDEPAFNVYFDEVRDWGIAALERAARGLRCTTAVHICYGYGIKANVDWKATLGSQWRQYENTFPLLAASSIGQVSLECANSHVPPDLMALLAGKDVLVGAIDVASDRVETPETVAATIRSALRYVPAERLLPCTNCGMVPLAREVAVGKLQALAAGAALVRAELAPAGGDTHAGGGLVKRGGSA
jgi:5-methyltetrahydropteroyltriglutamate--homocysteine methyltransferase